MELHRAVLLAALLASAPCFAQQDAPDDDSRALNAVEFDAEPSRCVSTSRIDRTRVIDDQTIAFFMRGGDVFVNSLPRRCPGLARENRFMYEVRNSRLCETDWVTVLERFGSQFQRGFTCRLGVYHPSNEDAVALLIEAAESGGSSPPVTVTPVDPPGGDPDAAAGGDNASDAAPDAAEPAADE